MVAEAPESAADQPGRKLPPADPDRFSRVASYLATRRPGW